MPWNFLWSDYIKKRACRYLLSHYLGHFLEEKLTLDQLSIDLYNGTGIIRELSLDVVSLNQALDHYNVPVEIVEGYIGSISVTIPWAALISDSTLVQVDSLELTLQPKQREENGDMGIEEMFSSIACMTSSLQLATEVLKEQPTEGEQRAEESPRYEKVEMFAQTIDTVLSHVKVSFENTTIRLEHLPRDSDVGVGLELRLDRIEYFDDIVDAHNEGTQWQPAFANKNMHLMGVQMFLDEFHRSARTFTRANSYDSMGNKDISGGESKEDGAMGEPMRSDSVPFLQSNPVQVALFTGQQQLKIKIKQNDSVQGPKLELEWQLGMINALFTPRQVHILIELIHGLATPWTCDDSNLKKKAHKNKSMHHQSLSSRYAQTVSGHEPGFESSVNYLDDGLFHSAAYGPTGPMSDTASCTSHMTEFTFNTHRTSTTSTIKHGSTVGHHTQSLHKDSLPKSQQKDIHSKVADEPSADLTHYKLKVSFLSLTVLHENFSSSPGDGLSPGETANEKLRKLSRTFFEKVSRVLARGIGSDLELLRCEFSDSCPLDHLGCLCKPLSLDCTQKMSLSGRSLSMDVSVGDFELVEALYDRSCMKTPSLGFSMSPRDRHPDYSQLLVFHPDPTECTTLMYDSLYSMATPCIRIKVDNVSLCKKSRRKMVPPKMDISFEVGRFESEIDITIIDRIHTLLHPDTICRQESSTSQFGINQPLNLTGQHFFNQALDEGPSSDSKLDVHLNSPTCRIYFKFPIPVIGAQYEHLAWWHRSLRKEVLIIDMYEFSFNTSICDTDRLSQLDFMCREAHGLFQESPTSQPVSLIYISHGTEHKNLTDTFNWPRVVVKWCSEETSILEDHSDCEETTQADSLNGACQFTKPELSPFSCRKSMYGTEGLPNTSEASHTSQEMVLPGDKDEMSHFKQVCTGNTKLSVDVDLPKVLARVHDRALLEIIYNRINNDLLLWEPCAPSPLQCSDKRSTFTGQALQLDILHLLKSSVHSLKQSVIESDSDSEDSIDPLYSIHDRKLRRRRSEAQPSKICVSLKVGDGELLVGTPLNEDETKGTSSLKQGELLMHVRHAEMFAVSEFNGDPTLKYVCIQSNSVKVFHDSRVDKPHELSSLYACTHIPLSRAGLPPCIYKSEPGLYTKQCADVGTGPDSRDIFSVAIKIKMDAPANLKEFLVSLAVRGATLRHRTCPPGHSWITQITENGEQITKLLDFINVKDYPIQGYKEPKVITELHVHLWNCAVDYRPLYLPLKTLVAVESFTISSNIIANSPLSLLRFSIDDGCLFLSDKAKNKTIDLMRDYVCVLDVEKFELSLLHNDGKDQKIPRTNLQASTNRVNIRTCSDSARALFDLILYYSSDGDLDSGHSDPGVVAGEGDGGRDNESYVTAGSDTVIATDSDTTISNEMDGESNPVDDLMADAMREDSSSPQSHSDTDETSDTPCVLYFVPEGERGSTVGVEAGSVQSREIHISESQQSVLDDSASSSQCGGDDFLDEFCVIDEPGLGILSRDGVPTVRVFYEEPIKIKENHFSLPIGRADELKAPLEFPPACYRYTLKEMTLTWCLYGGHDLELYKAKKAYSEDCVRVQNRSGRANNSSNNSNTEAWIVRGGRRRNMDVLVQVQLYKVRLQHETYPESAAQVSRRVIIVNNIEVRDRLAASSINKFLYHYTSDARPKQTHANMVLIKALTTRCANASTDECALKVSLLPIRLNIDQDTLLFLREFMLELSADESPNPSLPHLKRTSGTRPTPEPVLSVAEGIDTEKLSPDLLIKFDELSASKTRRGGVQEDVVDREQPVFFKSFVFSPEVPIRLDYHGKRIDMHQGTLTGLLAGLAQLNCSELRLKRLEYNHGLLGLDKVFAYSMNEWLGDVKKNQLPGILGGVGPMHSFVQIVQGIRDLFWLPIEQYQRDGRLVRGLQRGATSFTTSTAMALLELTNRLVQSVQYVAEVTYDVIAPGPVLHQATNYQQLQHKIRHSIPPNDFREGISNAYHVISEGITGTAKNIVNMASAEHERKGVTGAVGGVLRQIPPTIIQPIIIVTAATSNVLGGMRNQLRPDAKKEDDEKWKDPSP